MIIGGTMYYSFSIFTGKVSAPLVFKMPPLKEPIKDGTPQQQLQQAIQNELGKLLPTDTITRILNLLTWSILAGIFIFGGAQIAGLGVRMII